MIQLLNKFLSGKMLLLISFVELFMYVMSNISISVYPQSEHCVQLLFISMILITDLEKT